MRDAELPLTEAELRDYSTEDPYYILYMFAFKVLMCQGCNNDSECFHSHSRNKCRRRPKKLTNGEWNYSSTKCKYILNCNQGINCRFAHSDVEVLYHPEKFKTQRCNFKVDKYGICEKNGKHCSFAHIDHELRTVGSMKHNKIDTY